MRNYSFASRYAVVLLAAALLLAPAAWAQSAPIPSQLLTAKTAFLSNGGSTSPTISSAELYSGMYSALHIWGRYVLVNTPEEADLVLVVSFQVQASDTTDGTSYKRPMLTLSALDPKTHITLWTETEYAFPTGKKGSEKAFDNVVGSFRTLAEARHTQKAPEAAKAPAAAPEAKAEVKADAKPATPAADAKSTSKKDLKKDAKKDDDDTKKSHRIW
jgi:hypothetical protein